MSTDDRTQDKKPGVYGRNVPERPEHNKGVGEILEETRNQDAEELQTGGMGRERTPKDGQTQGAWHHDDEHPLDRVQRVAENEEDSDELPD